MDRLAQATVRSEKTVVSGERDKTEEGSGKAFAARHA